MNKMLIEEATVKLVLEALESCDAAHITDGGHQWYDEKLVDKAITALKALAEQPAQHEPVAYAEQSILDWLASSARGPTAYAKTTLAKRQDGKAQAPLYTTPQPAQRKPLTNEQIMAIGREMGLKCKLGGNPNIDFDYARAIETAHDIKEST